MPRIFIFIAILSLSTTSEASTVLRELHIQRSDTSSALPSSYSVSGVALVPGLPIGFRTGGMESPRYAALGQEADRPMYVVLGLVQKETAFFLFGNQGVPPRRLAFEKAADERLSCTFQVENKGTVEMIWNVEYTPKQSGVLWIRRLDFRIGTVRTGDMALAVALLPENALRYSKEESLLLVDQDNDGKFRLEGSVDPQGVFARSEAYRASEPVLVNGTPYKVKALSQDGFALELTQTDQATGFNVGFVAPSVLLETLQGEGINLAGLRGRVVVLNWWQTTCSPCIAEMPSLNELVQKYGPEDVVFLSIADNTREQLVPFFIKHQFDYTATLPNDQVRQLLGGAYPRHIIIDRSGVVAFNQTGGSPRTGRKLDSIIAALR